jgi:hypothetical protein
MSLSCRASKLVAKSGSSFHMRRGLVCCKVPSHSRPATLSDDIKGKGQNEKKQVNSEIWRTDGSEVQDVLPHSKDGARASGG